MVDDHMATEARDEGRHIDGQPFVVFRWLRLAAGVVVQDIEAVGFKLRHALRDLGVKVLR